ncbi:cell division protein FtsW [Candidatus Sumerlaeota bacterium]|nr:cell division protein FtsW [Candidatus Sumerlaeota bacterium]
MLELWRNCRYTSVIFFLVLLLVGLGFTMVYSSSAVWDATRSNQLIQKQYQAEDAVFTSFHSKSTSIKQLLWIALGVMVLCLFYSINYEWIASHYWLIYGLAIVFLILVLIPGIGVKVYGARRWLALGPLSFQPSEFAKLALIIFLSKYIFDRANQVNDPFKVFLPCLFFSTIIMALIVAERDFGAMAVVCALTMAMLFFGGVRLRYLAAPLPFLLVVLAILIILWPYRVERVFAVLDPLSNWHLKQSLISVGSGGIEGKGLGMGLQKYRFLAEAHTDFIFAMIGEELGLWGTILTLLIVCALVTWCLWVAYRTTDFQGALLASGISCMLGIPALLHIAVTIGLVPPKGLALPFVSYGGTSMLINMAAIGILMNVARNVDETTSKRAVVARRRKLLRRESGRRDREKRAAWA